MKAYGLQSLGFERVDIPAAGSQGTKKHGNGLPEGILNNVDDGGYCFGIHSLTPTNKTEKPARLLDVCNFSLKETFPFCRMLSAQCRSFWKVHGTW